MNVVQLSSGLGNQMFQYAFGLAVNAAYDRSWFDFMQHVPGAPHRPYGLDQFDISVPFADPALVRRHTPKLLRLFGLHLGLRLTKERRENVYEPGLLKLKRRNFAGYFQCERYFLSFRDRLRSGFRLRDPSARFLELAERMRTPNSVSVHVRRGDYVGDANLCLCSVDYYRRSLDLMRARVVSPRFFFFSDDMDWVRTTFKDVHDAEFVDEHWERTACDMMLMRECTHHVIANSSYSWWGAWLGEGDGSMIVAPSRWFADGRPTDIVPKRWIVL